MHQSVTEIAKHGYLLLFVWVTAEQLGAPMPAVPILIAVGVLSATTQLTFINACLIGMLSCLIGDSVWYIIGKKGGFKVLHVLCKVSLEPETCVRRSSKFISRYGRYSLLVAKFIPGISTVAVPLAANSDISLLSFLSFDLLGGLLYVSTYLAAGRILGARIEKISAVANSLKSASLLLALLAALAIIAWRFYERRKVRSAVARISPEELRTHIDRGENPYIVDLRHPLDMLADPRTIVGAIRMTPDELSARYNEIPRDREVVLYCT